MSGTNPDPFLPGAEDLTLKTLGFLNFGFRIRGLGLRVQGLGDFELHDLTRFSFAGAAAANAGGPDLMLQHKFPKFRVRILAVHVSQQGRVLVKSIIALFPYSSRQDAFRA